MARRCTFRSYVLRHRHVNTARQSKEEPHEEDRSDHQAIPVG